MNTSTSPRLFVAISLGTAVSLWLPLAQAQNSDPPAGFRSLFDGRTLHGWHAVPRLPTPSIPGSPEPDKNSEQYRRAEANRGEWKVVDGALVGGQKPAGSGLGAYLLSDEQFGDFELLVDMKPDWPADTGVMVRSTPRGGQGFQVHVDYRPEGSIGTFYGNGIGGFRARHYAFIAKTNDRGEMFGLAPREVPEHEQQGLAYACRPEEFFNTWRFHQWNTLRIRCVGEYPTITTWINGVKIAELDAANFDREGYDREAVKSLLGRRGHISLEVHDNDRRLGKNRWGEGAVCRWQNIFIKEL